MEKEHKIKESVFSTSETTRYKFPTYINDLGMDRSEARFCEVFVVIIEPGKATPLHRDADTEQLFYIVEGSGVFTIDQQKSETYGLKTGDLVKIPVGAWHSIEANSSGAMRYLAIDCFGNIRNEDEPTWDSHDKVLCQEQGWEYSKVVETQFKD